MAKSRHFSRKEERKKRRRQGLGVEDLLDEATEELRSHLQSSVRRLLTLPLSGEPPHPDDRREAAELLARLKTVDATMRSTVVRISSSFQVWALCEKACDESLRETATVEEAAGWARLAGSDPAGLLDASRMLAVL